MYGQAEAGEEEAGWGVGRELQGPPKVGTEPCTPRSFLQTLTLSSLGTPRGARETGSEGDTSRARDLPTATLRYRPGTGTWTLCLRVTRRLPLPP